MIGGRKSEFAFETNTPRRPTERPLGGNVDIFGLKFAENSRQAPARKEFELDLGIERHGGCRSPADVGTDDQRLMPHPRQFLGRHSNVRTTPLICGRQASETMSIFNGRRLY